MDGILARPDRVRAELIPANPTIFTPFVGGHISPGVAPGASSADDTTVANDGDSSVNVVGGMQHRGGASSHFATNAAVEIAGSVYTGSQSAYLDSALGVSVGAWVRLTSTPSGSAMIAARGDSNAAFSQRNFWFYINAALTITVHWFNGSNQKFATSTATVSLHRWHHIVWIARPNTQGAAKVFLDGVQVVSSSQSGNLNTNDRPVAIGALRQNTSTSGSSKLDGDIAHFYYWNRGLTDAEAVNLFVATHPGF
jgi:hypothetical protein